MDRAERVTVTNQTLLPQTGLAGFGSNSIRVIAQAALDVPTRVLTLTLTALAPNTGWYPEDPLLGFLYPNDSPGRGDGSISHLVRPKFGLPSGTRIENKARIVFDYNDPIDTPLVFNTIAAAAPRSRVMLSNISSNTVRLDWSGFDETGGSGISSYDIYFSTNRTSYTRWLERTSAPSATFTGESGATYYFYSLARDNSGHEEPAPAVPDTQTILARPFELRLAGEVELTNDTFLLHWNSEPGKRYRVQFKNDLNDPPWTDLGEVTATVTSASFSDPLQSEPQRFYRVQTVPSFSHHPVAAHSAPSRWVTFNQINKLRNSIAMKIPGASPLLHLR